MFNFFFSLFQTKYRIIQKNDFWFYAQYKTFFKWNDINRGNKTYKEALSIIKSIDVYWEPRN